MAKNCPVCGAANGSCSQANHYGGLTVNRLDKKELEKMSNYSVNVALETWYLNADKTEVVPEGDPKAAWLLVRAGSPIEQAIAERFNIETEGAESISRVNDTAEEIRSRMVGRGVGKEAEKNFATMVANAEAREELGEVNAATNLANPSASSQAALVASGIADKRVKEAFEGNRERKRRSSEDTGERKAGRDRRSKQIGGGKEKTGQAQGEPHIDPNSAGEQAKSNTPPATDPGEDATSKALEDLGKTSEQ